MAQNGPKRALRVEKSVENQLKNLLQIPRLHAEVFHCNFRVLKLE
jgi:hypothetical protein